MSKIQEIFYRQQPFIQADRSYPDRLALNNAIKDRLESTFAYTGPRSQEEIAWLQSYTGMGGMQKFQQSGQGILHEYFTPKYVCEIMWQLAFKHGYDGGPILEPSAGIGRMLTNAPKDAKVVAFEIDLTCWKIMRACFQHEGDRTFFNKAFETAFLAEDRATSRYKGAKGAVSWLLEPGKGAPFSMAIGNPPYGQYKNLYSSYFNSEKMPQFEMFFIFKSLQLVKSGGLLTFIIPSAFGRNGITYTETKERIFELGKIVDWHRFPPVFDGTDVPNDIIIIRKR